MSATWDDKPSKATPIEADEILIIDTADSRNQKRATLSSLPTTPATSIQKDVAITEQAQISYDTVKETLEIKGVNNTLQVGQESYIFVTNDTGVTLLEGDVVHIDGYDGINDIPSVIKSIADLIPNAKVSGVVTTTMLAGATGLITTFGRVNDLDTDSFTEGDVIYLDPTTSGTFTATKPIGIPVQIGYVGKKDISSGFIQVDIAPLPLSIRGTFSDDTTQTFSNGISTPMAFNTNDIVVGIDHDEITDNDEITFINAGTYAVTVEPQYGISSGGGTNALNIYTQKSTDSGATFVNIPDSNIKLTVSGAGTLQVAALTQTIQFDVDDKLRIMVQVENSNLQLESFLASGIAPNNIPATPSVIMNILRIGD